MSTQFFDRQDTARSNTVWLVVLFVIAVIALVTVTSVAGYAIALMMAGSAGSSRGPGGSLPEAAADIDPLGFAAICGAATAIVIVIGSLYQVTALRLGGGTRVAESVGGRQISGDVREPAERRLMNIVEEMAIASGTPVPPVYVLEEQAINAFAAGYLPGDAVIGVTRGAIEKLTREQLQGVIAHEFSHIFNGDMRMNIRMIGILHGILLLSLIGHMLLRSIHLFGGRSRSSRSDRDGGDGRVVIAMLIGAVVLIVIGSIGSFIGGLIKAAVSRQREFLADASAVQFTRNPDGIAGALKRIGGFSRQGRLEHPNAGIASHMYFAQGVYEGLTGLLATHPPLPQRIRAIDPAWDGTFPEPSTEFPHAGATQGQALGAAGFAGGATVAGGRGEAARSHDADRTGRFADQAVGGQFALPTAAAAVDQVGAPSVEPQQHSAELLREVDAELIDAAHEPYSARALVLALLLDSDPQVRQTQFAALDEMISEDVVRLTRKLYPQVSGVPHSARLPLVDLALPMLRMMTAPQYATFSKAFQAMVQADKRLSIFEWTLSQVLLRHLRSHYAPTAAKPTLYHRLGRLGREVSVLLSTLARVGNSERDVAAAFAAAVAGGVAGVKPTLLPAAECSFSALDAALNQLARASAHRRGELLAACAAVVSADGIIRVKEAELLRGIADLLDCPMPPLAGRIERQAS